MNYFYMFRLMIFIFFGMVTVPAYPIIKSLSLWKFKKDGKQVELFIIGDFHIGGGDKNKPVALHDAQDYESLKNILSSWNNSGNIVCMIESNEYIEKENKVNLEKIKGKQYWGMYYQLPSYLNTYKQELSKIIFDSCDLRGKAFWETKKVVLILQDMGLAISNILGQNSQAYLEKDTLQQNMKFREKKEGKVLGQEFFDELTKASLLIKEACQKEEIDEVSKGFLKQNFVSLDKGIEFFKTIFKSRDESTFAGIIKYIIKEAKLDERDQSDRKIAFSCIDMCLEKIEKFNTEYEKITNTITDAGFLISLLQHAKTHDKIVLFCGNNHAMALTEYLKKQQENGNAQNYITKGILDYHYDSKKKLAFYLLPEQARQILCLPFNTFLDKEALSKKDLTTLTKPFICMLCKKITSDKKFLRCSKCKSMYYCSIDCQRKNWKEHKNNCN